MLHWHLYDWHTANAKLPEQDVYRLHADYRKLHVYSSAADSH